MTIDYVFRVYAFDDMDYPAGTKLDGIQDFGGVRGAERFFGQYVEQVDGFDRITGVPVFPLKLMPGRERENLAVTFYFMITNHLVGHAAPGYPENRAGGEGSIALLFDNEQRALGFIVAAEPRPKEDRPQSVMTVSFYSGDGRLIDRLNVPLAWGRKGYGFVREGNIPDIAGITIENRDPAGIAIDDIIFDAVVPQS